MTEKTPHSQHHTPHICVVTRSAGAYSETFIRAQLERLPARITQIYGFPKPHYTAGDQLIAGFGFPWVNRLLSTLTGVGPERMAKYSQSWCPQPWYVRQVARYLRRVGGIQAVLAQYGLTGVEVLPICRKLRLPLVVHFHGYDAVMDWVLERYGPSYPELFEYASAVIAVSRRMEQQLLSLGAPPDKLHYIPYGIDLEFFASTSPGNNPPLFVGVGRFVPKKAPYLTLLAFHRVWQQCPDARLVLVGDGPLLEVCRTLVEALGLVSAVELPGPLPHDRVRDLMGRARAVVQHSVVAESGDSEGTPLAVLEAGAVGLPLVATRHAGIPDVVVEGQTGLLVDEKDVSGMAAEMLKLAQSPDLAATLGANARKHIAANYSMQRYIDQLWAVIASTI